MNLIQESDLLDLNYQKCEVFVSTLSVSICYDVTSRSKMMEYDLSSATLPHCFACCGRTDYICTGLPELLPLPRASSCVVHKGHRHTTHLEVHLLQYVSLSCVYRGVQNEEAVGIMRIN
jgi:hypothetical protein